MVENYGLYDIVQMKKDHPFGARRFEVKRVGSDIRVICLGCGRDMTVPRVKLEKGIKRVIPKETQDN